MADTADVKQLLLTVDANVELLRTGLLRAARDVQSFEKDAGTALAKVDQHFQNTGNSTGFARGQMLELTHVGKSLFDQIAAGQSPIRALSVELGRIGQIAVGSGGVGPALSSLVTLLGGPVVLAVAALSTGVGGLIYYLSQASDSSTALADTYVKENVSARTLIDAIKDLNKATDAGHKSSEQAIKDSVAETQALLNKEIATRRVIKAELEAALQRAAFANRQDGTVGATEAGVNVNAVAQVNAVSEYDRLKTALGNQDVLIGAAQSALTGAVYKQTLDSVKASLDPTVAATQRLERAQTLLNAQFKAGKINVDQLRSGLTQASKDYDAAIDAAKPQRKTRTPAEKKAPVGPNFNKPELADFSDVEATLARASKILNGKDGVVDDFAEAAKSVTTMNTLEIPSEYLKGMAELRAETEKAAQASERFASDLSSGLADAIVNAHSVGDALVGAIKRAAAELLASNLLDLIGGKANAQTGTRSGGLLSAAATALSSVKFFADGGVPDAGQLSIVGENGPELIVGNGRANVVPLNQRAPSVLGRAANGAGGGNTFNIDARGASDPAAVEAAATRAILRAAPALNQGIRANTIAKIKRVSLPGGRS